ncbi:MAG: inositol monophosphatase [Alphaproteobacteria bacterium]|nr:inositol monophosphatase [Alphaproteobacteria bacterium]
MLSTDLEARLAVAAAIARDAAALALRHFADIGTLAVSMKGPQDWLTEADGAVERLIVSRLATAFPADRVLGEEGGGSVVADRLWVIDPIDGTANFARGLPHFSIAIAFVVDGITQLAVVHEPVAGHLYLGRRGHGATRNGQRIAVSRTCDPRRAFLDIGYSSRVPYADYTDVTRRLLEAGIYVRQGGSGVLGLAQVADGRIDAFFERFLKPWDALAGLLLIEEAGGRVNDFIAGGKGIADGNVALGCTPALWEPLAALTALEPPPAIA